MQTEVCAINDCARLSIGRLAARLLLVSLLASSVLLPSLALAGCGGKADDTQSESTAAEEEGQVVAPPPIAGETLNLGNISFQSYWTGETVTKACNWRVLAVTDGQALIISEKVIELRPFHREETDVYWENSFIRGWLNGNFYEGLPAELKARVQDTQVSNSYVNPDDPTATAHATTTDKVFLLSVDEAEQYFANDELRSARLDLGSAPINEFRRINGVDELFISDGDGWGWWLRSSGASGTEAATVGSGGHVNTYGYTAFYADCGIRPAMWISY
ncbi:MAG: DUF6273 domain-containing protein [Coriobacteriales bacterium]|jgi:hypothetical protein|nr:DUF6273 domain-containing protein [Coriobacteriales bacterium]